MSLPFDPTREGRALRLTRRVAAGLLRVLFRVRVTGLEHLPAEGPVLLAGNHTGFLDGPVVFILLPRPSTFLVKSELWDTAFRPVLQFAHQIPIRRGTPHREALHQALDVLARGGALGMFPEGTRGAGNLETVQHGIGYLALRAGCPVLPVACLGTAEALPKGRRLPRWRAPVDVVFGPAFQVAVDGPPRARSTVAAAAEQIRQELFDHLQTVASERR